MRCLHLASTCPSAHKMLEASERLNNNKELKRLWCCCCLWCYCNYCDTATIKDLWGRVNTKDRASHSYILILWMSHHIKINGQTGPLKWCYRFKILIIERQISVQMLIPKEWSDFEHWNSKRNFPGASYWFKPLGMIRYFWILLSQ